MSWRPELCPGDNPLDRTRMCLFHLYWHVISINIPHMNTSCDLCPAYTIQYHNYTLLLVNEEWGFLVVNRLWFDTLEPFGPIREYLHGIFPLHKQPRSAAALMVWRECVFCPVSQGLEVNGDPGSGVRIFRVDFIFHTTSVVWNPEQNEKYMGLVEAVLCISPVPSHSNEADSGISTRLQHSS